MHHASRSPEMQRCIEACLDCYKSCTQTGAMCLEHGGKHAEAAHITLMADCAAICAMSADFMLRGSKHAAHLCRECAEICDACAADCERLAGDMPEMKACAETCRRCAESCRAMASVAA